MPIAGRRAAGCQFVEWLRTAYLSGSGKEGRCWAIRLGFTLVIAEGRQGGVEHGSQRKNVSRPRVRTRIETDARLPV